MYFQTELCKFGVSCFLSLSEIQALTPPCPPLAVLQPHLSQTLAMIFVLLCLSSGALAKLLI